MPDNRFTRYPKTALLLVSTVISVGCIFGVERYLASSASTRVTAVPSQRHIVLREHPPGLIRYSTPDDAKMARSDGLVRKQYRLAIDDEGFIKPSRLHDVPDLTLLFLGGSTTENRFVEEEARFHYLVGKGIEANGRRVNSYNAAFPGNNTRHSINILLNKGLPTEPDIAIMMHNINDVATLLHGGNYWARTRSLIDQPGNRPLAALRLFAQSIIDRLIPNIYGRVRARARAFASLDEFAGGRTQALTVDESAWVAAFTSSLNTFVEICRAHDITPVLMTQPSRLTETPDEFIWRTYGEDLGVARISYSVFQSVHNAFNETIIRVAAEKGVPVIDLANGVPPDRDHLYDFVHLNDQGSLLVAELIVSELHAQGVIDIQ